MIDLKRKAPNIIAGEMDAEQLKFWFDFKQRKFLHNIDTFYYSVKFHNDFTINTTDHGVIQLRKFFKQQYELLTNNPKLEFLPVDFGSHKFSLNLRKFSFAHMYTICLECPDWFDIFIAPLVPSGSDGGTSVTCEIVIQIRSYMLWMYGVHDCFERSYSYATCYILGGGSVEMLRILLGHESISTTQLYMHVATVYEFQEYPYELDPVFLLRIDIETVENK